MRKHPAGQASLASRATVMKQYAFALLVSAVAYVSVAPASAQLGSGLPDCDRTYRDIWLGALPVAAKDLAGGELVDLHRYALRAYDGCTSGDERSVAEQYLRQLQAIRGADSAQRLR